MILAVCHTIIIEKSETDGSIAYNAASPDELALVNAARQFGLIFEDRDESNNIVIRKKKTGEVLKFQLLNIIEFTSTRKRMSLVVKDEAGRIFCMCKGADSIMIPRLEPG